MVEEHEAWRLLTCIWLHAGVIHLAANMLSLVFIGIRLEQQFGFGMHSVITLTRFVCQQDDRNLKSEISLLLKNL